MFDLITRSFNNYLSQRNQGFINNYIMKFAGLAALISATSAANCIYPKEKITKP